MWSILLRGTVKFAPCNRISIGNLTDNIFANFRAHSYLHEIVDEAMSVGQLISVSFFGQKPYWIVLSVAVEETMVTDLQFIRFCLFAIKKISLNSIKPLET